MNRRLWRCKLFNPIVCEKEPELFRRFYVTVFALDGASAKKLHRRHDDVDRRTSWWCEHQIIAMQGVDLLKPRAFETLHTTTRSDDLWTTPQAMKDNAQDASAPLSI